jgi:hypothetical protein
VIEAYKNLGQRFGDHREEILSHSYRWNLKKVQEDSINALTKQSVVDFYSELFFENPRTLEFHQYPHSRREEGVNFRNQRVQQEGIVFIKSNEELKSLCDKFEDLRSNAV